MNKIALMGSTTLLVGAVLGFGTTSAKAATIDILENQTMLLGHILTNVRPTSYLFGNITGLAFVPTNDDGDDLVTNVTIANNMCSGAFVLSGNTCTFSFRITTADTSGINDGDVGTWAITAQIMAQWFDITINNFRTDTFNFNDTVNVTDPPVPAPSALPLFLTGVGALRLLSWRRKRKA